MAENLFPADETEIDQQAGEYSNSPVGYLNSIYFDDTIGDLKRDGKNAIVTATGVEAWEQWCTNCLLTEKNTLPAYGSTFGISTAGLFGVSDRQTIEDVLSAEIVAALEADPYGRTASVASVVFNWIEPDAVEASVTVRGIEDVTVDITVVIEKR